MRIRAHGAARASATTSARGRRRRLLAPAVATVALVLAGCAEVGDAGPEVTPGTADATDDGTGRGTPVLQIERSGGFVLMGTDFASVPELTVYADGRAITHGPQIAIYPPPALPNLREVQLDDADVDALVAAARAAGLLDPGPDYGQPPVADAPTTFVTLRVDGRQYEHAAEALGTGEVGPGTGTDGPAPDDAGEVDLPGAELLPGLTEGQRSARAELSAFVARAHELVGASGEGAPYSIEAFALMAQPAASDVPADEAPPDVATDDGAAGSSPELDGMLEPQVLGWPLAVALVDATECLVVTGDDAGTLRETLAGASSTALFEQAGMRYDVWFRPLLPHEDTCDDL